MLITHMYDFTYSMCRGIKIDMIMSYFFWYTLFKWNLLLSKFLTFQTVSGSFVQQFCFVSFHETNYYYHYLLLL